MKICKECKGTSIKSRSNFSHGKKSKSKTTFSCKNCGSTNVEVKIDNKRNQRQKR